MKELSRNKVIWMDENAFEVTVSVCDGDFWCQVMPFQVQSYSRHFQYLLSHIYMHQFYSNKKRTTRRKKGREQPKKKKRGTTKRKRRKEEHIRTKRKVNQKRSEEARGYSTILRDQKKKDFIYSLSFLFFSYVVFNFLFVFFKNVFRLNLV